MGGSGWRALSPPAIMDLREMFEVGKKHFESKNYARAAQYFNRILKGGARYADVHNMLGVIHHVEGKFNNAIQSFEKAIEINPAYTEATLNLAVLYNDLGEFKKAKALYSRIQKNRGNKVPVDFDPILRGNFANMHAHLGDTYREVSKHAEAIDEYKKALKLCPTYADIRTRLGITYRENRQKDLAVKELEATVSESPHYKPARIQLGVAYYSQGEKSKAAKVWKDVLAKDKDNRLAKVYLRLCENGRGKKGT